MADNKDVKTRKKKTQTKLQKRVNASPSKTPKAKPVARSTRKKTPKKRGDEFRTLCSLLGCVFLLMVMTVGVITLFDEQNAFDVWLSKTPFNNVIKNSDKRLYLASDLDDLNLNAREVLEDQIAKNIHAKKNDYDFNNLFTDGRYRYYKNEDGNLQSKMGIDVSYHQGDIDWEKVKNDNIDFVIIRIGYRGSDSGDLFEDTKFKEYIDGALDAGLDIGIYFFTQAITTDEAKEEAQFVINRIKNYPITYPVVIDTEAMPSKMKGRADNADLSPNELTDICISFCDTIQEAGYIPAIYANKSWFLNNLNIERLENYNKWLANYTEKTTYPFEYSIWQYSESGEVDGINTKVDMNVDLSFSENHLK